MQTAAIGADAIWATIAVVGSFGSMFVLVWVAARGHRDRDAEDAARAYFDANGRWPDDD